MSNVVIKDKNGVKKFLAGGVVFKITYRDAKSGEKGDEKMCGMVTTKEEYEKKLSTHEYLSIIHVAPLTYRLAYLYECLNREKGVPREVIFTFWHRTIGQRDWTEWFVVHPYSD